jgi:hypothetical protein
LNQFVVVVVVLLLLLLLRPRDDKRPKPGWIAVSEQSTVGILGGISRDVQR